MNNEPNEQKILELASFLAESELEQLQPNPLISRSMALEQSTIKQAEILKEKLETITKGFEELMFALTIMGEFDASFADPQIERELDQYFSENAAAFSPKTLELFQKAAAALYESELYPRASAVFGFLAFLTPNESAYHIGRGHSEYFQGHFQDAKREYALAQQLDPQNPHPLFYLAHCCLGTGEKLQAIQHTRDAMALIDEQPRLKPMREEAAALMAYCEQKEKAA